MTGHTTGLATRDALLADTGAIANGPAMRTARRPPRPGRGGFSPVVQTRAWPPVGRYHCEDPDCAAPDGEGREALLWHADVLHHFVFLVVES